MEILCSWCEEHPLEVRERTEVNKGGRWHGFYAGCSMVTSTNCPDTTGCFDTIEELDAYLFNNRKEG